MQRLSQVLALEKGSKNDFKRLMTDFYKLAQKPTLFTGARRTYQPIKDGDTKFPDERQEVQHVVENHLAEVQYSLIECFNITAVRDYGNCKAKADLVVDGKVILPAVPATYLLWLNKRFEDLETLIGSLPTLDAAEVWPARDGGISRSEETLTTKMAKEEVPLVLYDATEHHPAQTKSITKDLPIGYWKTTKLSGAISAERKAVLVRRMKQLHDAAKVALQEANASEAPPQRAGNQIAEFLFAVD